MQPGSRAFVIQQLIVLTVLMFFMYKGYRKATVEMRFTEAIFWLFFGWLAAVLVTTWFPAYFTTIALINAQ